MLKHAKKKIKKHQLWFYTATLDKTIKLLINQVNLIVYINIQVSLPVTQTPVLDIHSIIEWANMIRFVINMHIFVFASIQKCPTEHKMITYKLYYCITCKNQTGYCFASLKMSQYYASLKKISIAILVQHQVATSSHLITAYNFRCLSFYLRRAQA